MNKNQLTQEQLIMLSGALKNAKDIVCKCGGKIFNQGTKLKLLSRLLIGTEKDELVPIPCIYCIKCQEEVNIEEDNKGKEGIIIDLEKK